MFDLLNFICQRIAFPENETREEPDTQINKEGEGGARSKDGARQECTMNRNMRCRSVVMADDTRDGAVGVGSLYPRPKLQDALLWELINSQRIFNEQVKRAVSEVEGKCPHLGTCRDDFQEVDHNETAVECANSSLQSSLDTAFGEEISKTGSKTESVSQLNVSYEDKELVNKDVISSTACVMSVGKCKNLSKVSKPGNHYKENTLIEENYDKEFSGQSFEAIGADEEHKDRPVLRRVGDHCVENSQSDRTVYSKTTIDAIIQCSVDISHTTTQTDFEASDTSVTKVNSNNDKKDRLEMSSSSQSTEVSKRDKKALNSIGMKETYPKFCVNPYPCCSHMSCLYNHPGRLCTVLGKLFIVTNVNDAPALIEVPVEAHSEPPGGCLFLWHKEKPLPLDGLEEGTPVYFDAVVMPKSSKFTCLVVWQGQKPKISVEPSSDKYILTCEMKGILGSLISYNNEIGYIEVIINGKNEMCKFSKNIFYINGIKTSRHKINELINCQELKVYVDVMKFAAIDSSNKVSYQVLCSCVWKGSKPSDKDLQIALDPYALYDINMCTVLPSERQFQLYIDVDASLIFSKKSYILSFKIEDASISLPWDSIAENCKTTIYTVGEKLRAHILREKIKSKVIYKVVMLYPEVIVNDDDANSSSLSLVEASEADVSDVKLSVSQTYPFKTSLKTVYSEVKHDVTKNELIQNGQYVAETKIVETNCQLRGAMDMPKENEERDNVEQNLEIKKQKIKDIVEGENVKRNSEAIKGNKKQKVIEDKEEELTEEVNNKEKEDKPKQAMKERNEKKPSTKKEEQNTPKKQREKNEIQEEKLDLSKSVPEYNKKEEKKTKKEQENSRGTEGNQEKIPEEVCEVMEDMEGKESKKNESKPEKWKEVLEKRSVKEDKKLQEQYGAEAETVETNCDLRGEEDMPKDMKYKKEERDNVEQNLEIKKQKIKDKVEGENVNRNHEAIKGNDKDKVIEDKKEELTDKVNNKEKEIKPKQVVKERNEKKKPNAKQEDQNAQKKQEEKNKIQEEKLDLSKSLSECKEKEEKKEQDSSRGTEENQEKLSEEECEVVEEMKGKESNKLKESNLKKRKEVNTETTGNQIKIMETISEVVKGKNEENKKEGAVREEKKLQERKKDDKADIDQSIKKEKKEEINLEEMTPPSEMEQKTFSFKSALLKLTSKKMKPDLLMNQSGILEWSPELKTFRIFTKIQYGDIRFSVGQKVAYIVNGRFTTAKQTTCQTIMFDAYYTGLPNSNYRLLAIWQDDKPSSACTHEYKYFYELPCVILQVADEVLDVHFYTEELKNNITSLPVPQRIYTSGGDQFTGSLCSGILARVHIKVPLASTVDDPPSILVMVVMVNNGELLKFSSLSNLMSGSYNNNLNIFLHNKRWPETESLLQHLTTVKYKQYNTKKDLPYYLKDFAGVIIEKEEIGKVILCQLGKETFFIKFQKIAFVCSSSGSVQVNSVPNKTVVRFDAFQVKEANEPQYTALFVWTGKKRVDGIEYADGTTCLYHVAGKLTGIKENLCEYELELDGTKHFACMKTRNVILADGNIGEFPPPGSNIHVHLKKKKSDDSNCANTLFLFTGMKDHIQKSLDLSNSVEEVATKEQNDLSLQMDSEYPWCIYNGSAKLVCLEDGTRKLKFEPNNHSVISLHEVKQVFFHDHWKDLSDIPEGTIISFDAVQKNSQKNFCYRPVILWVGQKPKYIEQADVKYAYEVEGFYHGLTNKGKALQLNLNINGKFDTYTVEKSGYIYFVDGAKALDKLEAGNSVLVHLRFKKQRDKEHVLLLFMIVKSEEHIVKQSPNTFISDCPTGKEKLIVKVNMQTDNQKILPVSKIKEEGQSAPTVHYFITKGKLHYVNSKPTFTFQCENQESVTLPTDFVVEGDVKSDLYPFYMTIRSDKKGLFPLCGWYKTNSHVAHLQHNLLFHCYDKKQKIVSLKDNNNGKYVKYLYHDNFIYMGKTKLCIEDFAQVNHLPLHAVVEDSPPKLYDGCMVSRQILFLSSNLLLARTVLKFFVLGEVDLELERTHSWPKTVEKSLKHFSMEDLEWFYQTANSVCLSDLGSANGNLNHIKDKSKDQNYILSGDELKARFKETDLQHCFILKGFATKIGPKEVLLNCIYKNTVHSFNLPSEFFKVLDNLYNETFYILICQDPRTRQLLNPLCSRPLGAKKHVYILTNQTVVSFNTEFCLIGLSEKGKEFCQMYCCNQRFFISDKAEKLPITDILASQSKYKTVNVVVEDCEKQVVQGHIISRNILFVSIHLCYAVACANMFTLSEDELFSLAASFSKKDANSQSHLQSAQAGSTESQKVTYTDFKVYPKDISCISYGSFSVFSVKDNFAVLNTKKKAAIVCRKQFFVEDKKLKDNVPLTMVLKEGDSVGAYVTEMKEPILTRGTSLQLPITEIALIAFLGKKPKESSEVISEWKHSPEKIIRLPGKQSESVTEKTYAFVAGKNASAPSLDRKIANSESPVRKKASSTSPTEMNTESPSPDNLKSSMGAKTSKAAPPDNCMTKGKIERILPFSGFLERSNGSSCKFRPDQIFLFSLCLQGKRLTDVLHEGIEVDYEMCDDLENLKGIWIGDFSYEPSALYEKVEEWCKKHNVPQDVEDDLLRETGWLPEDLEPVFDFSLSKEIVDVDTLAWQSMHKH